METNADDLTPNVDIAPVKSKVCTERINLSWKVRDMNTICPRGVNQFGKVFSSEIHTGTTFEKPMRWIMLLFGDDGHLSFHFILLQYGDPETQEESESDRQDTLISGSMKWTLKNAEKKVLHTAVKTTLDLIPKRGEAVSFDAFMEIKDIWEGLENPEIENSLTFTIVLDLLGHPMKEDVKPIFKPNSKIKESSDNEYSENKNPEKKVSENDNRENKNCPDKNCQNKDSENGESENGNSEDEDFETDSSEYEDSENEDSGKEYSAKKDSANDNCGTKNSENKDFENKKSENGDFENEDFETESSDGGSENEDSGKEDSKNDNFKDKDSKNKDSGNQESENEDYENEDYENEDFETQSSEYEDSENEGSNNDVSKDYEDDELMLECEGVVFPVQKSILIGKSKRIAAMLDSGPDSKTLKLDDMDSDTAGILIGFVYTEEIDSVKLVDALKILNAAKTYEVEGLISVVLTSLCQNLNDDDYDEVVNLHKEFGAELENNDLLEEFKAKNAEQMAKE